VDVGAGSAVAVGDTGTAGWQAAIRIANKRIK